MYFTDSPLLTCESDKNTMPLDICWAMSRSSRSLSREPNSRLSLVWWSCCRKKINKLLSMISMTRHTWSSTWPQARRCIIFLCGPMFLRMAISSRIVRRSSLALPEKKRVEPINHKQAQPKSYFLQTKEQLVKHKQFLPFFYRLEG